MRGSPGDQTRTCRTCCKEIAFEAKKCPFCQHWQGRFSALMHHPLFSMLFIVVPMGVLYALSLVVQHDIFLKGEPFHDHAGQVTVVESKIEFGEDQHGPIVAVVGRIKNSSPVDWKESHLQVVFFNSKGELIDAGQENEYRSPFLPTEQEVAFKVSFPRQFPESEYASHKVGVISAKDSSVRF